MSEYITPHAILLAVFCLGYLGIIFEYQIKVNKTAVALLLAGACWVIYFVGDPVPIKECVSSLSIHLSGVSQILFFLLGAMTLVELIDSHKGFDTVVHYLHTNSMKRLLWLMSFISFFLSAILDNLTTTILMISLLRKLVPVRSERFVLSIMVVVASNAGGAWTPIGDVTTTMLWIGGQLTTLEVMREIFIPSLVSMLIPLGYYTMTVSGETTTPKRDIRDLQLEPGAHTIFVIGLIAFLFVPVFKWLTGLPPFMGMIVSLAVLWIVTDLMHHKHEQRDHLRVPFILTKIDVSNILFFLGILLSVDAIESTGLLSQAADLLDTYIGNTTLIAAAIGIFSAIIDNVPLVAATMGMYPIEQFPQDSKLWMLIAYAAGTGGSMLLIGSSAGVALMGIEKISFFSYMRKATLPVFAGFLVGLAIYVFM